MATKFKNFFTGLIPSQKGEYARAILMFVLLFLIISVISLLKPLRQAQFLKNLGAQKLPYLYMLQGLVSGTIAFLYARYVRTARVQRLIVTTLSVSILSIFAFWWLNTYHKGQWLYYVFYLWTTIFGLVATSQIWLLGNRIFNAREAKRNFSFIAAGAILGGILGSKSVKPLVNKIDTVNLLLVCMVLLTLSIVVVLILWGLRRSFPTEAVETASSLTRQKVQDLWGTIKSSRLLLLIAIITLLSAVVSNTVDFQYQSIVAQIFGGDEKKLAGFFGEFTFYLSLISFGLQLFVTKNIVKRFGLGVASGSLPAMLLLASVVFILIPILGPAIILWGAIFIKISDKALKYSINKTGMELFYIPIPYEIKVKAKVFTDWLVVNLGQGLAGLLLLPFIFFFSSNLILVSVVVLFMLSVWLLFLYKARKTHTETFKEAVQKHKLRPDKITTPISDPELISQLISVLDSDSEGQVLWALKLLEGAPKELISEPVQKQLTRSSPELRIAVIHFLKNLGEEKALARVQALTNDPDEKVKQTAFYLVSGILESQKDFAKLKERLHGDDRNLRGATISVIKERSERTKKALFTKEIIDKLILSDGENKGEDHKHAAEILGSVGKTDQYTDYFITLLTDTSPTVVCAAVRAVAEAERVDLFHILVTLILDHRYRIEVRKAVASLGDNVSVEIQNYLTDENQNPHMKHELVRALGAIQSQKMANFLLQQFLLAKGTYRVQIIKALNKQRFSFPELNFNYREVQNCLEQLALESYSFLVTLFTLPKDNQTSGWELFKVALQENLNKNREHIFRLLGLIYPPEGMHGAFEKIQSSDPHIRANAIEYLEAQLKKDLKDFLFPLLDDSPISLKLDKGTQLLGIKTGNFIERVSRLADYFDSWLGACALYALGESNPEGYSILLDKLEKRGEPLLEETALLVKNKFRVNQIG